MRSSQRNVAKAGYYSAVGYEEGSALHEKPTLTHQSSPLEIAKYSPARIITPLHEPETAMHSGL
jgi:hypothetical protein